MAEKSKDELSERAQLVRLFEAACEIEYPTPEEANFRIALMKKVGLTFGLREVRPMQIAGPVTQTQARPAGAAQAQGGKK